MLHHRQLLAILSAELSDLAYGAGIRAAGQAAGRSQVVHLDENKLMSKSIMDFDFPDVTPKQQAS